MGREGDNSRDFFGLYSSSGFDMLNILVSTLTSDY